MHLLHMHLAGQVRPGLFRAWEIGGKMSNSNGSLRSADRAEKFGDDVPEYFFYLLFQAMRRRDAAFETVLATLDLSLAHWRAISTIRRMEGCAMTEVATFTAIDRTTLTRSIDQLVRRGLVARQTPDHDRRQVRLHLTEAGEQAYNQAVGRLMDFNRQALAGVDEARRREISRGLATVVANLAPDDVLAEALIRFEPGLMRRRKGEAPAET